MLVPRQRFHFHPLLNLMKNRHNRRKHKISNSKRNICKLQEKGGRKLYINSIQIQRRLKYVATSSGIDHLPKININNDKIQLRI